MRGKTTVIVLILSLATTASGVFLGMQPAAAVAGDVEWYKTWTWADAGANSVWSDGTSIYTAGYTGTPADFALSKWDSAGNAVWSRTWGGVSGDYANGIWGDGTYIYTTGHGDSFGADYEDDLYLVKWNTAGNVVWNRTWQGSHVVLGRAIWGDGTYVYAVGETDVTGGGQYDIALVKWDTSGTLQWGKTCGGSDDEKGYAVWGIGTSIYTAGSTKSYGAGETDFWLVKWDNAGNVVWNRTWGDFSFDEITGMWGDGTYLYMTGYTRTATAANDIALSKWDTDGNKIWNRTWGGTDFDEANAIWGYGTSLYVAGMTESYGAGSSDFTLIKWDTAGNIAWNRTWGGSYLDTIHGVWGDSTNVYTTGITMNYGTQTAVLVKWAAQDTTGIGGYPITEYLLASILGIVCVVVFRIRRHHSTFN